MDLDDAFKRAVQKYYSGMDFEGYKEAKGASSKYNKESLDSLEELVKPKEKKVVKNASK